MNFVEQYISQHMRDLIKLTQLLEINQWLEMYAQLEDCEGLRTENFTFEEWFALWLVRQNEVLFNACNQSFSDSGFFELSKVIPNAPVFKNVEELQSILTQLRRRGLIEEHGGV